MYILVNDNDLVTEKQYAYYMNIQQSTGASLRACALLCCAGVPYIRSCVTLRVGVGFQQNLIADRRQHSKKCVTHNGQSRFAETNPPTLTNPARLPSHAVTAQLCE